MKKRARHTTQRAPAATPAVDPRYAPVVTAFSNDPSVTRESRKGFGSGALKVKGRIFAMMSSHGAFVVKLPRERVDELVNDGVGERFDPGGGRIMKEWIAIAGQQARWMDLAREAHQFVKRRG